ncbi:ribosomal-protein-alanine N-acetyltransferase [Sinobacterium caligoides]|uniref:Ribosomal-protein-alanine N-acetyltransferase n=1 Tax=Sinobacterium caligoides TaxID=933926 RepID=A0A3N2DMP1_9GAMM|nr:GNAT family N-acetyltransferase [Sinobacterium caligoides]ROS01074.1 ribosomal-protein-alanine N-acetyltransferase [Sinobacterium caligoides]
MMFEVLSEEHTRQLYQFEVENKAWFESFIAPREASFYTIEGVSSHIQQSIVSFVSTQMLPLVLVSEGQIIARANLRAICRESKSAEVGYRVAKQHTGKGVASLCLAKLISEAELRFDQLRLSAKVLDNNPASRRVLEKHLFQLSTYTPNFMLFNEREIGCTLMERSCELAKANSKL